LRSEWENNSELRTISFNAENKSKLTIQQDSILGIFYASLVKNNLIIDKIDKKLSIITVSVSSTNELFSKYFSEVLIKVVSDFYVLQKSERAAKNVAVLQKQTDSVRRILNQAISGVASSTDINPNPNPNLATLRVPSQHRQIDVQANTAILTQLVTNLEIAKMSLLQSTPLIQVIDGPILPLEKVKPSKKMALVLGGIISVFLMVIILSFKKLFQNVMNS